MKIIATVTISFQNGYDSSAVQDIHALFDSQTTLAEVMEWSKQYKNCLSCSNITIAEPLEPMSSKEEE